MFDLSNTFINVRYWLRVMLGSYRWSYPVLWLWGLPTVNQNTEICVEGFQRSANTYAIQTLKYFNPSIVTADHTHVPYQIKAAVKTKLPCGVIIRTPIEALSSTLIVDERLNNRLVVNSYNRFYRTLLQIISDIVIMDFDDVINDINSFYRKIENRYMITLNMGKMSNEIESEIFERIRNRHTKRQAPKYLLPLPSEEKQKLKQKYKMELASMSEFKEAQRLYERVKKYAES